MKIIYVCNEYPPEPHGGIGTATKELVLEIAKRGHQVTVVGMYPKSGEEIDTYGIRFIRLKKVKYPGISWYLNRKILADWIYSEVKNEQIDIVESPEYGGWLLWTNDVTSVLRLQGSSFYLKLINLPKYQAFFIKQLEIAGLKAIKNWIGVSNHILNETQKVVPVSLKHKTVIPNPVNTDIFRQGQSSQLQESEQIVLFVGSVSKRKGAISLAKAAKIFMEEFPKARLVFLGRETIHEGKSIQSVILDLVGSKLTTRVSFIGVRPHNEVIGWMQKATVFTMPSYSEGCPHVWLEAMACHLPVVGSTMTCGPEVIEDGISGLLANPDSPEDIADKISQILRDKDFARNLGENARRRAVEMFSIEKVADQTLEFYKILCEQSI